MNDKEFQKQQVWKHPEGTRYQVLLTAQRALTAMDDWISGNNTVDIRVRRAKTKGMIVIETTDVIYASHIVMFNPNCKVNIIFP